MVKELFELGSVRGCVDESLKMAETVLEVFFSVKDFSGGFLAQFVDLVACGGSGPSREHVHDLWIGGGVCFQWFGVFLPLLLGGWFIF